MKITAVKAGIVNVPFKASIHDRARDAESPTPAWVDLWPSLAAVSQTVIAGCEAAGPLKMTGEVVKNPPDMSAGTIRVPDGPGLALEVDDEQRTRYGWPATPPPTQQG